MKPIIYAGIIARNEARDIGHAIASIRDAIDGFVLIDTGSTDDTIDVAVRALGDWDNKRLIWRKYVDASERDEHGNWRIVDFAKARNCYVDIIDASPATHLIWLDADEQITNPDAIRRAAHYSARDVFGVWVHDGGSKWLRQCMWKTRRGIRFAGAVHEYPVLGDATMHTLDDCAIVHDGTPAPGQEDSNARNLRILLANYDFAPSARDAFYLGNTYKDGGNHKQAVPWYQLRLAWGDAHRDEWLFTHLYLARSLRALGEIAEAERVLRLAMAEAPKWAELHMEYAFIAYADGRHLEAIERASVIDVKAHVPVTHLFREVSMYRDQPLRLMSWCAEAMDRPAEALDYAERAADLIGGPDADWTARIERLRRELAPGPAVITTPAIDAIGLCRPGAIGDILMTLNLLPALKAKHPGRQVYYFCDRGLGAMDALGSTLYAAGVDYVMDCARWEEWRPRFEKAVNLIGYPIASEGYPEKRMAWHLVQYFAAELGLVVPGIPSLKIRKPARPSDVPAGPYATVQTQTGWSRYKEWPRFGDLLTHPALIDIPLVRIGEGEGRTLAQSIAVVANAALHIGLDSWANHATHYTWMEGARPHHRVPAVILFGSTQASASGYPENKNISLGLHCQPCFRETHPHSRHPRGPCVNLDEAGVHRCMAGITVRSVADAVARAWVKAAGRVVS